MEKTYVAHLNKLDVEASGLLGFFDSDNQYIIENDIIQELILANKLIETYENDKITATAKVGEFKISFNIYLQEGEGNKKRAGLFVVEKCKLEFANVVQTYVDSFIGLNNSDFFIDLKKKFHLYAIDESEGIDMANSNLLKIKNKKSDLLKKYKSYIPLMMDADMAYVKKMIALMKANGKYSPELLEKLRRMIEEKGLHRGDPNYWREVKIMLDKILIQNKAVFTPVILAKMDKVQEEYVSIYNTTKLPNPFKAPKKKGGKPKKFEFEANKPNVVKGSGFKEAPKVSAEKDRYSPKTGSSKDVPEGYVRITKTEVSVEITDEKPYEIIGTTYINSAETEAKITHTRKQTFKATKIEVKDEGIERG